MKLKSMVAAACVTTTAAGFAADYNISLRFVDVSNNPVARPTTPNTDFYVGIFAARDTGLVKYISGYALEVFYNNAACDHVSAAGNVDISTGLGRGSGGITATGLTEDALHDDGNAGTNRYRRIIGAWDYTNPILGPVGSPASTDGMVRLKFRTTATPVFPIVVTVRAAPTPFVPIEEVDGSPAGNPNTASSAIQTDEVPVSLSGFEVE